MCLDCAPALACAEDTVSSGARPLSTMASDFEDAAPTQTREFCAESANGVTSSRGEKHRTSTLNTAETCENRDHPTAKVSSQSTALLHDVWNWKMSENK